MLLRPTTTYPSLARIFASSTSHSLQKGHDSYSSIVVLWAMAEKLHIPTSYEDRTPAAWAKRVMSSNIARKRFANWNDNAEGPPDQNSDYKDGKLKRKATSSDNKGAKRKKTIRKKRRQSLLPILVMRITRRILGGWNHWTSLRAAEKNSCLELGWPLTSWMLLANFPDLKGLQPTLRAKSKQRGFIPQTQGSLQIHHSEQAWQWVTSCFLDEMRR